MLPWPDVPLGCRAAGAPDVALGCGSVEFVPPGTFCSERFCAEAIVVAPASIAAAAMIKSLLFMSFIPFCRCRRDHQPVNNASQSSRLYKNKMQLDKFRYAARNKFRYAARNTGGLHLKG